MATNFRTKIPINWLCVNDSYSVVVYVEGFEWSADRMQILPIPCRYGTLLRQIVFGFRWTITYDS